MSSSIRIQASFFLSEQENNSLNAIVKRKQISKPDLFRKAISLYLLAAEASEKNVDIEFMDEQNHIKTKIVGL